MTTPTLDPSPLNQLGKGFFAADEEAKLIADGYIFAAELPPTKAKPFPSLVVCKRLIADAVTESEIDAYHMLRASALLRQRIPATLVPSV